MGQHIQYSDSLGECDNPLLLFILVFLCTDKEEGDIFRDQVGKKCRSGVSLSSKSRSSASTVNVRNGIR